MRERERVKREEKYLSEKDSVRHPLLFWSTKEAVKSKGMSQIHLSVSWSISLNFTTNGFYIDTSSVHFFQTTQK